MPTMRPANENALTHLLLLCPHCLGRPSAFIQGGVILPNSSTQMDLSEMTEWIIVIDHNVLQ